MKMMPSLRKAIPAAVALFMVTVLLYSGCTQRNEDVSIGILFPLTGDAASYGERGRNGVELAISEINESGGIGGKQLRAIYEDSKADPTTGASAMTKLVTVDKVPAVVGDIVSATTLAAAPIAESNKVILLAPTASAPAISQAGSYVFRIWPSDLAEGRAIANYAAQSGYKKVAILYMQNDYGVAIQDIFSKTLSGAGGQVTAALGYKPEETDFRSYLTRIAGNNPEAIYLVSYYKDGALAMKQARELGIKTQFLGTTALEDPKLFDVAGSASDGVIYPLATGFETTNQDEKVQSFLRRYKQRFNTDPDWVPAQTYDAVMLLASVMRQAGTTGPELQRALSGVKGYRGVTGEITFDENGDVIKPVSIKVIRGNSFQKVEDRKQAVGQ